MSEYEFSQAAADRVINFFGLLRHSKGSHVEEIFNLLDWQSNYLTELFGWLRPDGSRKYRRSYLSMGRGNGKSTFAAGIALYCLLADGEQTPFIALAASTREQASIIYDECLRMVKMSPKLRDALHPVPSKKVIEYPKKSGVLKALSSDAFQAHGLDISCLIFDEVHTCREREFHDALLWGASKDRRSPLVLYTTTAGYDKSSVCYEIYTHAKNIIEKKSVDQEFLPAIFEAEPTDPIDHESTWKKANPSLGACVSADKFKVDLEAAKVSNGALSAFKRQKLNIWTQAETQFIDLSAFDRCKGLSPNLDGRSIVLGCDLASTSDLAALGGIIFHEKKYYVRCWAWTTEDAMKKREKQNLQRYEDFVKAGELEAVPGNVIDYKLIRQRIEAINKVNPIRCIVFDKWGSTETVQYLQEKGFQVFTIPPSPAYFHEPTKRLEKLILDGKLVHDGNSLLRWTLGNLQVKESNGLIKPTKSTQSEKIDPWIALIQALYMCREGQLEVKKSRYESDGLLLV